ncbi:MAG: hypothetical protein AAF249_00620 [Pseudomonadota bacterium]
MFWKRLRKDEAREVEPSEAEIAAEAGARRRLDRLKARRDDEQAAAQEESSRDGEALKAYFDGNAFVTLNVAIDADQGAIAQAADDLSFSEDVDPDAVEAAQAELLAPRDRVKHELAWLPELNAEDQAKARRAVSAGDADALFNLRLSAIGLARINLGLTLLTIKAKDENLQRTLMADLVNWDAHTTRDRIDEARSRARFSPTSDDHYEQAVSAFRDTVGRSVAEALSATREGRILLAQHISENSADIRACDTPTLEAIVKGYGSLADPQLQNLRGKIVDAVASLEANPRDPAKITLITTTLDLWSQWRLPLQKLEEARGLDDPQSAELFKTVRELGITLTNDHNMYDESLRIAKALKHCFSAVPGLQQAVERDLPTLIGNVLFKRFDELTTTVAKNLRDFTRELDRGGIGADVGGLVGKYCEIFDELLEVNPHQEGPWTIWRELAVAIAEKLRRVDIALMVVEWLLERNSPEQVRNQLVSDMCQMQRILKDAK